MILNVPHDEAAEAAVLGSMIVDSRCIPAVLASGLSVEDFYLSEHREIFAAILSAHDRIQSNGDGHVDGLLVREELERRKTLDKIGGTDYLQQVTDTVPSAANIGYYAGIVRDRHVRRLMLAAGEKLLRGATDLAQDVGEEVAGARMDLAEIVSPQHDTAPNIEIINAATWLTSEPPACDQILADTVDRGDKTAIIGSSKLRKSFFLLQLALSIASGRDFLGWSVPQFRRVLLVQLEVQQHHFHRRVRRMAAALELTPEDLEDRLLIINARGLGLSGAAGIEAIRATVEPFMPELIGFDPLYKLATGAENAAEDMKVILGLFDQVTEQTGAAVLYVHHDAKGFSGDRDIRDRGAGSNVLSRDYDAAFALTPHSVEDDAVVVETLLRNYAPQQPMTIGWVNDLNGGYCFGPRPDLAATKKTSTTARAKDNVSFETCHPIALQLVKAGPMLIGEFKDILREKTGVGQKRIDRYVRWALTKGEEPLDVLEQRSKGRHEKRIGTPTQIQRLREQE
ncbi:MAG: AAA family ATPase [Phycisphaerae bacterium]|nr:AAA family ATPase [Phycisphaerae bacterium]